VVNIFNFTRQERGALLHGTAQNWRTQACVLGFPPVSFPRERARHMGIDIAI
jgi:hypothetical protein